MPVVRVKPSDGGDLITTESEAAVDVNNYTIKRNIRRVAFQEEGRREGDTLFRPNIDADAEAQYSLPDTGGEEITLIHTGRHPDGSVVMLVATPTRIFRLFEIGDNAGVTWDSPYAGATGDDADPNNYPIYGVTVKTFSSSPSKTITTYGDWYSTSLVGEKIIVDHSGVNKAFDITAVTLTPSSVSGTFFTNITGVTQPGTDLVFATSSDPTTHFSVGDFFYVGTTTSYDGTYQVKSMTASSVTVEGGTYTSTETGFLYSEDGANTVLTVNDGVYDEDSSGYYASITAVSQPASDLVFDVDTDPTTFLVPTDTITVSGTGDPNYDTTHTVLSVTATQITVTGGTFTATATGSVEKPEYDLITEISAYDKVVGNDRILPVYSTTESGRWSLLNPKVRPGDPTSPSYLFSAEGHRWEAVDIGGKIILNNGVDLPISFDMKSFEANFIYELREAGYAFVGTICAFNGMLICMDIAFLEEEDLINLMNRSSADGIFAEDGPYGRFTDETKISRISYRLVGSPIFNTDRFGVGIKGSIASGSGNLYTAFPAYSFSNGTELHVPNAGPSIGYTSWATGTYYGISIIVEDSGKLWISKNAGISDGTTASDDIGVKWEEIDTPAYEDLITTVTGSFVGNLTFSTGIVSAGTYFQCDVAGTTFRIDEGTEYALGATETNLRDALLAKLVAGGLTGYTFTASGTDSILITATSSDYWPTAYNIDYLSATVDLESSARYLLVGFASNTVEDEVVQRNENFELAPEPFFYDLADRNSVILRGDEMKDRLAVFKNDVIYVGSYTGDVSDPISFERVYVGNDSIYWKWTLAAVDGDYFVYAGKNRFYRFDLVTKTPRPLTKLGLCDNLFFDHAIPSSLDRTYATVNSLTREVWFFIPDAPVDKILCWDFEYDTCSTIDRYYSAASITESVLDAVQYGASSVLFVMGTSEGALLTYGLSDINRGQFEGGKKAFSRNGVYEPDLLLWVGREEYDSVYQSGLNSITQEFDEVILKSVGVIYSSSTTTNPDLKLTLFSTINPSQTKEQLFEADLTDMGIENTVQAYYLKNYYQDKGLIKGFDYAGISSRIFSFTPVDTQSVTRDSDA